MAKKIKTHNHRNLKHLPYGTKLDKRAYEWCAMDSCQEPAVKDRGYVKEQVKKEIKSQLEDV